jgi:hypothetical protein
MFTVFASLLGTPLGVVAALILARRLDPKSARSVVIGLAGLAALLGWLALGWTILGPTYVETAMSTSGATTTMTRSLLDVGLSSLTALILLTEAACFGLVLVGALDRRSNDGRGKWLMLMAIGPPVAIGLVSFGLIAALPGVVLAETAVALAFSTPGRRPEASTDPSGSAAVS